MCLVYGDLAELVDAADCGSASFGFESQGSLYYGEIAQLVERKVEALGVGGSSPSLTTFMRV